MKNSRTNQLLPIILISFIPSILISAGEGALLPSLTLIASQEGLSHAMAGMITSTILIGTFISNIPGGIVVSRIGERYAMILACFISIGTMIASMLIPGLVMLTISAFLSGASLGLFAVARHSFMTLYTPVKIRARTYSLLGGSFRLGFAAGPFLVSLTTVLTGSVRSVFAIHLVISVITAVLLFFAREPKYTITGHLAHRGGGGETENHNKNGMKTVWRVIRSRKKSLLTIGTAMAVVSATRSSRTIILPLVGLSLGLNAHEVTFVIGIGATFEALFFYSSGFIMDRWGRIWSAAPSLILIGVGYLSILLVHDYTMFVIANLLLAAGNTLGSGIILTLGSDLAGSTDQTAFISVWRMITDLGQSLGPVGVSSTLAILSLGGAATLVGVASLGAAGLIIRYLHVYLPPHKKGCYTDSIKTIG